MREKVIGTRKSIIMSYNEIYNADSCVCYQSEYGESNVSMVNSVCEVGTDVGCTYIVDTSG